jgi:hypothetical protein
MYDAIYTTIAKAGVVKELDDWVYQDREGNIVSEDDPQRFGRATKHVLTHPGRVLFVDEVMYRKVQQTGSELTSLGDLNTTNDVSGETFCKFLHQEVTAQREEATQPLTI